MRFVTTLKSTFLMLSQHTHQEGSQKFEPETRQAKYREVTRQNPKAEWRSVLSPKLHCVIWTLRPAHHHQMPVTAAFSGVTVPNMSLQCVFTSLSFCTQILQKDLHGFTYCQTQGMVSLVPHCGMILKHAVQSE